MEYAENYRDEWVIYQTKYENSAKSRSTADQNEVSGEGSITDNDIRGNNNRKKFRLPKIELKKFNGDVRNWIGFWGQFKKIHDDNDIDAEDKFQYLIQTMEYGSSARELVESFPHSAENYNKAMKQLRIRFARDEFLIEVYVRELLNIVLQQATKIKKGMSLSCLFDKLETELRALESLGVTSDKYAAMFYPLVESALPENILVVWERHRHIQTGVNI